MEEEDEKDAKKTGDSSRSMPKIFAWCQKLPNERSKHLLLTILSVATFCGADLSLHFVEDKSKLSNDLRVFSVLLRGSCQLILGVILAAMSKSPPWKPVNRLPLLLVLSVCAAAMVFCLDLASKRIYPSTLATVLLFIPILTSAFSITLVM